MPVTASSEDRISGWLRRVVMDLEERSDGIEWIEALCQTRDDPAPDTPCAIVFSRDFPLWMAILEGHAFLSVDLELLHANPRARFTEARNWMQALSWHGYDMVFDHRTGQSRPTGEVASRVVETLSRAGGSRQFAERIRTLPAAFISATLGYGLGTAVLIDTPDPLWIRSVQAVGFGLAMTAFRYFAERRALRARLTWIRGQIVRPVDPSQQLAFTYTPKALLTHLSSAMVFGLFAWKGISLLSTPLLALSWAFLASMAILSIVLIARGWGAKVILDESGVEFFNVGARSRIEYTDVDTLRFSDLTSSITVSSFTRRISVPDGIGNRVVADALRERIEHAKTPPYEEASLDEAQARLERRFADKRPARWLSGDFVAPPMWMAVRLFRHVLRGQYRVQRQLLTVGRPVLAKVIESNPVLGDGSLEAVRLDAVANVMFGFREDGRVLDLDTLDDVNQRLEAMSGDDWETFAEESSEGLEFAKGFGSHFPLLVRLPASLAFTHAIFCTSLVVTRRHLPLGRLRADWLPIVVSPAHTRFAIVLPLRFWDPETRRVWKQGRPATEHAVSQGD